MFLFAFFILGCVVFEVECGAGLYMGPYFPSPLPSNITVHQDTVAYLPCTVKQLGDKSVSWIRQRDADILTVDRYTFVRDERLTVHYVPDTETWTLVIKYVQERDAGSYECQISTEPKMSKLVHLHIIVPQVEVIGDVDKYVRKGSTARLECTVSSTVQLPDYIFWYHAGERLLEYDHPRAKISVSRRGGQGSEMSITSTLVITKAQPSDDGNYTCLPSNLHSASTILHVLNDEHPAAMQTGAAMLTDPPSVWGIILIVLLAFIFVHGQQNIAVSSYVPGLGETELLQVPPINRENKSNWSSAENILQSISWTTVCGRTLGVYMESQFLIDILNSWRKTKSFGGVIQRCFSRRQHSVDTKNAMSVDAKTIDSVSISKRTKGPFHSFHLALEVFFVSCITLLTYHYFSCYFNFYTE
ncbi:uncharacterized protein [Palaemon carinicauda]|uniref:uncharacterized protein n=1 Tax=Palaemon carinicauda TaxID=392227 RepID=UPI0035B6A968